MIKDLNEDCFVKVLVLTNIFVVLIFLLVAVVEEAIINAFLLLRESTTFLVRDETAERANIFFTSLKPVIGWALFVVWSITKNDAECLMIQN